MIAADHVRWRPRRIGHRPGRCSGAGVCGKHNVACAIDVGCRATGRRWSVTERAVPKPASLTSGAGLDLPQPWFMTNPGKRDRSKGLCANS